jgi:hypothetical protein
MNRLAKNCLMTSTGWQRQAIACRWSRPDAGEAIGKRMLAAATRTSDAFVILSTAKNLGSAQEQTPFTFDIQMLRLRLSMTITEDWQRGGRV